MTKSKLGRRKWPSVSKHSQYDIDHIKHKMIYKNISLISTQKSLSFKKSFSKKKISIYILERQASLYLVVILAICLAINFMLHGMQLRL